MIGIDDLMMIAGIGAASSALLGGGMSLGNMFTSANTNYKYSKRLQDDAQAHQVYMYQNQNQWRVNDLRAAGLNPILATHGGSAMPSSSSSAISSSFGNNNSPDFLGSLAKVQGFSSARDKQKYDKEMHDVKLAQEEAFLANSELDAEYKRALIEEVSINSALKMLDLDYLESPFAKSMRYYKSVMDVSKNDSKIGQYFDSVQNTILRPFLLNSALDSLNGNGSNPVKIMKKSKSNYTKYQYKTR